MMIIKVMLKFNRDHNQNIGINHKEYQLLKVVLIK